MFKPADKSELNQISLTGLRSLVLLGFLMESPKSLEEIKDIFVRANIFDDTNSLDTIRIDINSLKVMGCEISRATKATNNKYVLKKNPFSLQITQDNINVLKKIYGKLKEEADINLLLEYHELFEKISNSICDENIKEAFKGISVLKYQNLDILESLLYDCYQNRTIQIIYSKPTRVKSYVKEVIAQKLVYQNNKIFLYAYDSKDQQPIILNIQRIKKIVARKINKTIIEPKYVKIKFLLEDTNKNILLENEKIIAETSEGYIIEGQYHNNFVAIQRVLSLGDKCIVLEPDSFRNNIIILIKEVRKLYE